MTYWGLRAYGTAPQVWGGGPDCAHQFTETSGAAVITGGLTPKQVTNAGSFTGNRPSDKSTLLGNGHVGGGPKLHSEGALARYQPAATCTRCGAWRGELGSEPTPDCLAWARGQEPCSVCFVCHLVTVFRAVRRVLHDTGTVFCNLGDSYSGSGKGPTGHNGIGDQGQRQGFVDQRSDVPDLGPKQLMMMPARVALALQADGWVLRSAITWAKKAPMPESVRDRPTNATEMVYLLAKNPSYYYDAEAVRQPNTAGTLKRHSGPREMPWAEHKPLGTIPPGHPTEQSPQHHNDGLTANGGISGGANLRNFWLLGPEPLRAQHYAAYPTKLVEPCMLAGTSARGQCPACGAPWRRVVEREGLTPREKIALNGAGAKIPYMPGRADTFGAKQGLNYAGGHGDSIRPTRELGWAPTCSCDAGDPVPQLVLDPFLGSGTTAYVARHHGRRAVGIELNESYARLAADRLRQGTLGLEIW